MNFNMKIIFILSLVLSASSAETGLFETGWISGKPQVLTYRSTDKNGSGLYQVSVSKKDTVFEIYTNIIYPGFAKTVTGTFTKTMKPLQSKSKIIVNGQIAMDTQCIYEDKSLTISTLMSPYNRVMAQKISFDKTVIDFSQIPILTRTLNLKKQKNYIFKSVNPQKNKLESITIKVIGDDEIDHINCYKVEVNDFEGNSIYWVEQENSHRILRVEQPDKQRITELLK